MVAVVAVCAGLFASLITTTPGSAATTLTCATPAACEERPDYPATDVSVPVARADGSVVSNCSAIMIDQGVLNDPVTGNAYVVTKWDAGAYVSDGGIPTSGFPVGGSPIALYRTMG
jgi:hypothetical protein